MENKRVNLTLNLKFFDAIAKKADERAMSVPEYIYDTLRDRVFAPPAAKSKAGRPKKVDDPFIELFSRKR